RGDDPLRDIDHDDPQREPLALRAEGVRAAGIPAAEPADIDAALQIADDEAAKDRAQQVRDREFQSELEHALRILRRTGQPSLPARSCLLVRVLAELQPASIARRRGEHEAELEELVAAEHGRADPLAVLE